MTLPDSTPATVHFTGICGRMVGGLAVALRGLGVQVTGSDDRCFSPMKDVLSEAGISVRCEWSADLPDGIGALVTGGLTSGANVEVVEAMRRGVPVWNATRFLAHYFLARSRNHVVVGTKGKTTATAMLAWILRHAGVPADHLIGGQVRADDWPLVQLRLSPVAVIEGDEYRCSVEDSSPKIAHFRPHQLLVTNIAHDHPDVFADADACRNAIRAAVHLLPHDGRLVLNADDPGAMSLVRDFSGAVQTAGFAPWATVPTSDFREVETGCSFCLGGDEVRLTLHGRMNARNAALAIVAAEMEGVRRDTAISAISDFPGVRGRMEIAATPGRSIIYSEEACHPLSVHAAITCVSECHTGRRIIAIIFPVNTGGLHGVCQRELPGCLARADAVIVMPAIEKPVPPGGAFDHRQLADDLGDMGLFARTADSLPEMIERLREVFLDGDIVVLFMSIGPGIALDRIINALTPSP